MGAATVVSLRVRPLNVSHLCFPSDGILDTIRTSLGATVSAFDFGALYILLPLPGDAPRLHYDSVQIDAFVAKSALASLRSEIVKAQLHKAINTRENAYLAKYLYQNDIINTTRYYYSADPGLNPTNYLNSKPQYLNYLTQVSNDMWKKCSDAYNNENPARTYAVKSGVSGLASDTTSFGYSASGASTDSIGANGLVADTVLNPPPAPPSPDVALAPLFWPPSGQPDAPNTPARVSVWDQPFQVGFTGNTDFNATMGTSMTYQTSSSQDRARQNQTITNNDYGYRVPFDEGAAQYYRAQISLIDQMFAQFMSALTLPNSDTIFNNERKNMDSDVYMHQIAYLNTILLSSIDGIVTGIYKRPGDAVKAGEPVIRIEANTPILLEGTLLYPGLISVGSIFDLSTNLFDSGSPGTISGGKVVLARGRPEDNQWDVVVQCDNVSGFPLGYCFDYDDTTVAIS